MLIHFKCHNKVHHRFGYELPKKVYIVYGSPCAGKSTWVKNMGTADDLIIDIDKIWECISFCDKYNKPRKLQQNIFETRNCLIDQVKMRLGNWQNAFIVGTYPLKMERQRLADKLGAELIYIDCDEEICLSRAKDENWKKYIEEWFESFQE